MIGKNLLAISCSLVLVVLAFRGERPNAALAQRPSADKSDLLYSTFLGGERADMVNDVALDSHGNVYVGGLTCTDEFLTVFDPIHPKVIGCDPFVAKFDADGALVFATALGGTETNGGDGFAEAVLRLVLDSEQNIYVTGSTNAGDFPTTSGAFDRVSNAFDGKAFIAKFDREGKLLYSTLLGGQAPDSGPDWANGIAVNSSGQAFVTGYTRSPDFPTTGNAYDKTFAGGEGGDAFLAQFSEDGTELLYGTYLGRQASDEGVAIGLDANEDVIIAGHTNSPFFPTTPGAFQRKFHKCKIGSCSEGFVAKFSGSTGGLLFSTLIGGKKRDEITALVLDETGAVYITGQTDSRNFPTTAGAYDTTWNDEGIFHGDAFVVKLNATGSDLAYSTFLGGAGYESGRKIAVDAKGAAYVVGYTTSENFPTTRGAFDRNCNNGCDYLLDGFFVRLNKRGTGLRYGTFLGGGGYDGTIMDRADPGHDSANGVAVDTKGIAHVVGFSKSSDFPTTPDAYDTSFDGDYEGYFLKIKPTFHK